MKITVSDTAISHMKTYLEKRGHGIGIRLGVKTSGCSGLAYVIEFVDQADAYDEKISLQGIDLFVDKKSSLYLDGISVDFVKDGVNEGFKFKNPNASGECGCGESFTV